MNIGCEAVSIFIYKAMQHVRANKELSIFYLAKKLDKIFFLFEGYTWSNMTSGEGCYHIIKIFEHGREVSTDQAIEFGIPVAIR